MSFELFIQLYAHFSCFIRLVIIFYQNLWDMTGIFILHCIHQEQYFCTLIKSMFQFFHLTIECSFSGKKFLFVAEIFAVFLSNVKIVDYTITHLTRSKVKEVMADTQLNVLTPLCEIVTSEKV